LHDFFSSAHFFLLTTNQIKPTDNMPRISDRKRVLTALEKHLVERHELLESLRAAQAAMDLVANNENNDNETNNDNDDNDSGLQEVIETMEVLTETLQLTYNEINGKRYLVDRKPYRTGLFLRNF
jgi:hypothetical protein